MRPVILNRNNLSDTVMKNKYTYNFPRGSVYLKNTQLALGNLNTQGSFFNITSATTAGRYNNNTYSYIWTDGGGISLNTVLMPDGLYLTDDLNAFLQSVMLANGHYLINASGDYVYYLEIVDNAVYDAIQLNSYPLPIALPAGWSNPAAIAFPAVASTPQFVIPSTNNFGTLIGFSPATYPAAVQATNYSVLSDLTPTQPVESILITCNILRNDLAVPNTFLYGFVPDLASFASWVNIEPNTLTFVDVVDGTYNSFTIEILDQSLRPIYFNDDNLVLNLVFSDRCYQ